MAWLQNDISTIRLGSGNKYCGFDVQKASTSKNLTIRNERMASLSTTKNRDSRSLLKPHSSIYPRGSKTAKGGSLGNLEKEISRTLITLKRERGKPLSTKESSQLKLFKRDSTLLKHDVPEVNLTTRVQSMDRRKDEIKEKVSLLNTYETKKETSPNLLHQFEMEKIKEELKKKDRELNEQIEYNKKLENEIEALKDNKKFCENEEINKLKLSEDTSKTILMEILKNFSQGQSNINLSAFRSQELVDLCEQIGVLVDDINKKRKSAEEKYGKLLEVQNDLIEVNSKKSRKEISEIKSRVADENEYLKNQLINVRNTRLQLEAENERLRLYVEAKDAAPKISGIKNETWASKKNDISETEDIQARIIELDNKLRTIEDSQEKIRSKSNSPSSEIKKNFNDEFQQKLP